MPVFSQGSSFTLMAIGDVPRDQVSICADAKAAVARNSPAAPGLLQQCGALRAANVAAGVLLVDAQAPDAALRVNLTDTGRRIIAGEPRLAAIAKTLGTKERGFAIGVKVARAIGGLNPAYASWVSAGMSPDDAAGFALGLQQTPAAAALAVQGGAPAAASSEISPVTIGIGVGVLGAAALIVYKLTR